MRVAIIGGGPVSGLLATQLRTRSIDVHVYERAPDPRATPGNRGHSFNLTLTERGLSTLDSTLRGVLYRSGIPLPRRVIHHTTGDVSYQDYGLEPRHHLLTISRDLLHRTMLDEAERAGARLHFGHECVRADTRLGSCSVVSAGRIERVEADLLIGCDGANSTVRHEMSRNGARSQLCQEYIGHGYLELRMPPADDGMPVRLGGERPAGHGMHIWPRGEFMLIAQPNRDASHTTTLFLPMLSLRPDQPSFQQLSTPAAVLGFFRRHFPDVVEFLPHLVEDFLAAPPASLRTVRCHPFHHGRTVLIGDAAHTMVPFYGQGINCSFEDVRVFLDLLDAAGGRAEAIPRMLAAFTDARKAPCDAIADLSLAHLHELTASTGDRAYHDNDQVERRLQRALPTRFAPLYWRIAFSSMPYHEAVARYRRERSLLDALCSRFDVDTEWEQLVAAFSATAPSEQRQAAA